MRRGPPIVCGRKTAPMTILPVDLVPNLRPEQGKARWRFPAPAERVGRGLRFCHGCRFAPRIENSKCGLRPSRLCPVVATVASRPARCVAARPLRRGPAGAALPVRLVAARVASRRSPPVSVRPSRLCPSAPAQPARLGSPGAAQPARSGAACPLGAARPLRLGAESPPKAGFGAPSATFSTLWQARFRRQHPHQAFCVCREARRRKAAAALGETPGQIPLRLPQSRKSCRMGCIPCFAAPTTESGRRPHPPAVLSRETAGERRSRLRGIAGTARDGFTRRCRTCTRSSRPGRRRRRRPA